MGSVFEPLLKVERVAVDLRQAVAEAVQPLALLAASKRLAFTTEIAPDLPECIVSDPGCLRRILLDLIGNAIRFAEDGGVNLAVRRLKTEEGNAVHVSVAGAGRWLAKTRRLIKLLGGRVWMDSKSVQGGCVHFMLPEGPGASAQGAVASRQDTAAPVRILLVEDNPVNQLLARTMLERRGYAVTVAENGRLGTEAYARQAFALVLMDVQMPEMCGLEATRAIRADEAARGLPRVPIVAFTANAISGDRERCLAAGMDDYLSKPVNKTRLYRCVADWLGSGQAAAADIAPPANLAALTPEMHSMTLKRGKK